MRLPIASLAVAFVAGLTVLACSSGGSGEGSSEEDIRGRVSAAEAERLHDKVDDNCAGNDNGWFKRFDVATFDAAATMAKIKDDDRDSWGVGCFGDHAYSSSKADAVELFKKHLAANEWEDRSCLEEYLSSREITRLHQLVADPTNLAVFASVYDGHGDGNSEACAYYNFYVFRADGREARITFNHTD
jgi:hypothetical protein